MTNKQIISLIVISLAIIASSFFFYFHYFSEIKIPQSKKVEKSVVGVGSCDTTSFQRLKYAVEEIANSDSMKHGGFGFYLSSIDSEKVLIEVNSEQSLVPASVLKTVTTGVGLITLGPGFHYSTRIQYDGTLDKTTRVLDGNIYIKGMGDPSLGSPVFMGNDKDAVLGRWVAAIKALGIDSIHGAIVGDGEVFEEDPISAGWAWEDIQSDYGAGPSGLAFRENLYDIKIKGGSKYFKVEPEVPGLILYNQTVVGTGKDYGYVMGSPYQYERVLKGEIKNGSEFTVNSPVPDPPFFCAHQLYLSLKKNGISASDSSTTTIKLRRENKLEKKDHTTFYTTFSPSLSSLVYHTNHVSQNFYAETILRTISLMKNGFGSCVGGARIVYDFLDTNHIKHGGFYMVDGSGVSRYDGVTAKQLVQLLTIFAKDTIIFDAFYQSLPICGESGTVSSLCKGTMAESNVHAKSGYMSRVRCYTGYVTTRSGRMLAFSMLANNHGYTPMGMRDKLEGLMVLMAELE